MTRRVIAVVPDLFFAAKIRTAAAHLGVELDEVAADQLVDASRERPPNLVIVDLHGPGEPLTAVRALKADVALAGIEVVGFYSHVDDAARRAALDAGVDQVLARSAFTVRLARLLEGAAP
jgi:DNA-binding NarL/FixJ family response regulator